MSDRPTSCKACGVTLGSRGSAWRCTQVAETGGSGGLAQSFGVCSWCIEQMVIRGAVLRAHQRRAATANQNVERYQRAKLANPPWMQRRQQ